MTTLIVETDSTIPAGASVNVTVYEDTNADGVADNQDTVSLAGGTGEQNETADVFDGSEANDYWVDIQPGVTGPGDGAASVDRVTLIEGTASTGGDSGSADATTMDDFNDGDLVEWDRVDSTWGVSTTHAYEGSHGLHSDNQSGSTKVVIALAGSLAADFGPGDVYHFPYKEVGGSEAAQPYFGKQDTSRGDNTYILDFRVFSGTGGIGIDKIVSGVRSELVDVSNVPVIPSGGEWGHVYLMWDTDEIAGDIHDADANQTGDFYVEIQDDNGVPKFSAYFDTTDSEFRGGGVGFRHNDANNLAYDLLEVGTDSTAFPDFNPGDHFTGSGEIHFFKTADLRPIDNPETKSMEIVGSGEVAPARGDFCLKYPAGAGFSDTHGQAAPGANAVDLPNYLPDGEVGRCFVRTPDVSVGETYVGCASAGSASDYLRVEVDWSNDRFRGVEYVAGGGSEVFNVTGVGWASDTWYEVQFDRTTLGDVTVTATDDSDGTQAASASHTLHNDLVGNDGILLVGGYADTAPLYVDHWINDTQAA